MGLFGGNGSSGTSMPDHGALLAGRLEPGDDYVAHGYVTPAAYARSTEITSNSASWIGAAIGGVQNAFARRRHIGGSRDSISGKLSVDLEACFLVLGTTHLTWWSFGGDVRSSEHFLTQRISRQHVASIHDTSKRAPGGRVIRITFTDGSFFDCRTVDAIVSDRFHESLSRYGRGPSAL